MNIHLMKMHKWRRRFIAFFSDCLITVAACFGAMWLTANLVLESVNSVYLGAVVLIQSASYIFFGLYRGVWRFASIPDLMRILKAVLVGTIICLMYVEFHGFAFPLNMYITYGLLLVVLLSGTRLLFRWVRDYRSHSQGKRVLIVGAGSAGEGIVRDLYRSSLIYHYNPVVMVDDDYSKHGFDVHGIRVAGSCNDLNKLIDKYKIDLIFIAIPSATSKQMREIVTTCENSRVSFRTLPSIQDVADGNITVNAIREVLIEDLLGREQVYLNWEMIRSEITNETILVTGGGGSIGSELCRQICELNPKQLIIIDNNEFNLYSIDMELNNKIQIEKKQSRLCSVTDRVEMEKIFKEFKPNIVFHVAAYKHVPLLENHLRIAMYNNIIGTKTAAELSEKYNANKFVLISTDKAVNPTNIMGATKRASEIFCQTFNRKSKTQFITVRFGNVLNSAGSVIPLFRNQIVTGGPLTVTHRETTRYFMTIAEASQLILQAATLNGQGDIYVLDMGEPINIYYLAEQMIRLSGKKIGQEINIEVTGLRPGEKLHEELLYESEDICQTIHPKITQAKVTQFDESKLSSLIHELEKAYLSCDEETLKNVLCQLVPEYQTVNHANHPKEQLTNGSHSLTYA